MNNLDTQLVEFRKNRRTLVNKKNWDSWYFRLAVVAPMGYTIKDNLTAYDIMRMSVASGYGYAWIPTPPDKTDSAWLALCKRFVKADYRLNFN